MSTIQDVSAEQLAKLFHHYREALVHDSDGHGIKREQSSWDRTPHNERKLMVAAARLALIELATTPPNRTTTASTTPSLAKPNGAAEPAARRVVSPAILGG